MAQARVQGGYIPTYADKLLFAEDLVNFMLNSIYEIPYKACNAEYFRDFIYNAFNETVREAVYNLHSQVEMSMFGFLAGPDELHDWDGTSYLRLATEVHNSYFKEGFEAKDFLLYCIEVTILAKKFRDKGLLQAPDLAVYLIFISLQQYNMLLSGWDSVNFIASNYVTIFHDGLRVPTPDTFASEISSSELLDLGSPVNSLDSDDSSPVDPVYDSILSRDQNGADIRDISQQMDHGETDASVTDAEDIPAVNEEKCDEDKYVKLIYDEDEALESVTCVRTPVKDNCGNSGVRYSDEHGEGSGILEETRNEEEMHVDDNASSGVNEGYLRKRLSPFPRENAYSDPGGAFQSQKKDNCKSFDVGEKHEAEQGKLSLKSNFVMNNNSLSENPQPSFHSVKGKPLQSSGIQTIVEESFTKSGTNHEVYARYASNIEALDSKMCVPTKESSCAFKNPGMRYTAEQNCRSLSYEDGSKAFTSRQLPLISSTLSSPSSFTEKAVNSSNELMFKADSETVSNPQKPRGLKRFPVCDYESSPVKKSKLS